MASLRQPVPWCSPAVLAAAMAERWGHEGLIWLDGDGSALGRWATLAVDPLEQRCCRGLPGVAGARNPFAVLSDLGAGHWCGWLSYEAAAWVEPGNPWKADSMASLWIARHDPVLRFDLQEQELWLEGEDPHRLAAMASWLEQRKSSAAAAPPAAVHLPLERWHWHTNLAQFARGVEQIRSLIASGDLFQANLTACCSTELTQPTTALDLFARLRQRCPAPFAGLVVAAGDAAGEALISASPERFLQVSANGLVETRPIKGTRPRDRDPRKDADQAVELVCSVKDRAENVMIVDLLRNDLGRVCQSGSIHVPQLVGLESYPQVHHLTSVVNGQLHAGTSWVDLLRVCWPGGSITGAPKLRACQRLAELEPVARGPYCGSVIRRDFDGSFDSSILIRSLLMNGTHLRCHAGCGIVADSDPQEEARELGWKLNPVLEALQ
jgi:para-aminobenzoate synthetase component 1